MTSHGRDGEGSTLIWLFKRAGAAIIAASICSVAAAATPDTRLIGYCAFIPHESFSSEAGPAKPWFAAIRDDAEWRTLWVEIEPRLARDMAQRGAYPLSVIDFSKSALIVAASGAKSTGGIRFPFGRCGSSRRTF